MKTIVLVGSGVVSIPPKYGGATEIIIYEISRSLPKNKFNVFVLDRKEKYNKEKEIINGVFYIRFKAPKFNNVFLLRLTEFIFGMRAINEIRKINNESKADIVHAHTVFTAMPLAIFKFLLPQNTKLIYTCHNPAWNVPENEIDFFNGIIKKIEGYVMQKADLVTTVSDSMRENIIKQANLHPQKIQRIYNFVDMRKFSPKYGKSWKRKMKIKGPLVLFVSKLTPNKGVEYVIRSAPLVKEIMPGAKYVLAGPASFEYEKENPWNDLVKELDMEDTIIFTGALNEGDLPKAYASADVFCFPTLRESFGIVVIEAMASGLPVITSNIDVLKEIVDGYAILVKPKNTKELASKIILLLKDFKARKKFRVKSLKRSKNFGIQKIMSEYANLYWVV